jgi:hypothetical protein
MTTNDVPADTGVDGFLDALLFAIGSTDDRSALADLIAARDAAQRAERDAEWRTRTDDITALKCAEARADERERIAQAIEAMPIHNGYSGHWLNGWLQGKGEAANIARAGTAGGSDA